MYQASDDLSLPGAPVRYGLSRDCSDPINKSTNEASSLNVLLVIN